MDVTGKTICECLYLISGRTPIYARCLHALDAHTPTTQDYLSIFVNFFDQWAPNFLGQHDSPSNLAESRYLPYTPLYIVFVRKWAKVEPELKVGLGIFDFCTHSR